MEFLLFFVNLSHCTVNVLAFCLATLRGNKSSRQHKGIAFRWMIVMQFQNCAYDMLKKKNKKKKPFYACQSSKRLHMLMCLKACSICIIGLSCHETPVLKILYGPAPVWEVAFLLLLLYSVVVVEKKNEISISQLYKLKATVKPGEPLEATALITPRNTKVFDGTSNEVMMLLQRILFVLHIQKMLPTIYVLCIH